MFNSTIAVDEYADNAANFPRQFGDTARKFRADCESWVDPSCVQAFKVLSLRGLKPGGLSKNVVNNENSLKKYHVSRC